MNSVNYPYEMVLLKQHEEAIYFASDWYVNQMRAKRQKMIREGWITPRTPRVVLPVRRVIVMSRPLH